MLEVPLQPTSLEVWEKKYQLKDNLGKPVDKDINGSYERVARALAAVEPFDNGAWEKQFRWALENGATPAGRIMSNAGAGVHKPATSLINCCVSKIVNDNIGGILQANMEAGITLSSGAGIGYEFSTLRPRGAFVAGAGANTSGPLSFMDIFDAMCFTISSAGGRRGAMMATFAVWHPDVLDFVKAKREDGRLRQFNCSLLITEDFMEAVKSDSSWDLVFPIKSNDAASLVEGVKTAYRFIGWDKEYCEDQGYTLKTEGGKLLVLCKVYQTLPAREIWDTVMASTFDFSEPGFILIDKVNEMNNSWFCENIRATNPCKSIHCKA